MDRQSGSYAFGEFDDTEYQRLIKQGSATWSFEREFLEWAGLKTGDRVADVACGPGVISRLMAEYVGDDGFVTGIDISNELLETAEAIKRENSAFERGSVYDLSDHREQYDFVYARLLFQHLERPWDAMRQIFSILKPGGRICVLDSDESVFGIFPPHGDLSSLIRESQALQAQRGGDRFVGGKLGYLLRGSGFEKVAPRIFVMTPENMGRDTFLDVVLKFRPQLFPAAVREEATERMQAIYDHALEHMTYGHNGSFVVKAVRPVPGPATRAKA
ncbi:putative Methyltransferase [Thiocapsa sp. KS1]|nr:class I SAM-dependent methyltransferase [Thiocapsa sp. KS1]CRI67042.1 putative Methyltransferase [Thiocapsa sp. KS1]